MHQNRDEAKPDKAGPNHNGADEEGISGVIKAEEPVVVDFEFFMHAVYAPVSLGRLR
jgi:hypothetical protein